MSNGLPSVKFCYDFKLALVACFTYRKCKTNNDNVKLSQLHAYKTESLLT
jgi:hypothetical protein